MLTIEDILLKENGEIVNGVKAQLTKLWDAKTGTGQYGPYSFQNGTLQDATGEIRVVFKNRESLPKSMIGKVITISPKNTAKGLVGVTVNDSQWTDKNGNPMQTRELHVTAAAILGGAGAAPPPAQRAPAPTQRQAQPQSQPQRAPAQLTTNEIRARIHQLTTLYGLSIISAIKSLNSAVVACPEIQGLDISPGELAKSAASCAFIEAVKGGLHMSIPRTSRVEDLVRRADPQPEPNEPPPDVAPTEDDTQAAQQAAEEPSNDPMDDVPF